MFKKDKGSVPKRRSSKSAKTEVSKDVKTLKKESKKPQKSVIETQSFENVTEDECQIEKSPEKYLILHSLIGKGSFGEVYLVQNKLNHQLYAMKILKKSTLNENDMMRYAFTEKEVMAHIDHPYIVKLRYAFQNEHFLYLFMDYMPGGNLSERIERGRLFLYCKI